MKNLQIKILDYHQYFNEIRNIRFTVFVKEQNVPQELEIDDLDEKAIHILCYVDNKAVATGRIIKEDGHIGRIAVLKEYRGKQIGKMIMIFIMEIAKEFGLSSVWLSSQLVAKGFYKKLGFKEYGEIFLDAGIEHINMKKKFQ
jgi:predicted GNAT family N-acyltransferase